MPYRCSLLVLVAVTIALVRPVAADDAAAFRQSIQLNAQGRYSDSMRILDDLAQRYPDVADVYFNRSIAAVGLGDGDTAASDARAFLDRSGWKFKQGTQDSSQWAVVLGHFGYRRAGRKADARTILDEAAVLCDRAAWPYPMIQFLRGELSSQALYERPRNHQDMVEVQAYLGIHLALEGDFHRALVHLDWTIENCNNPEMIERGLATAEKSRLVQSRGYAIVRDLSDVPGDTPALIVPDGLRSSRRPSEPPRFTVALGSSAASGPAQAPRSPDQIARDFNARIQSIHQEIDSLRRKLADRQLGLSDAAGIIAQQSALRVRADDLWASTQAAIDQSFRDTRRELTDFNARNRSLEFESAVLGSRVDAMNNVGRSTNQQEFDKNRSQYAAAWQQTYGNRLQPFGPEFDRERREIFDRVKESYGIDLEAEGYNRIGTSNPYTGEVYYKYYDKSGNPLWVQWKDDANGWKKYQADLETVRRRQRDLRRRLESSARTLNEVENQLDSGRRSVDRSLQTPSAPLAAPMPDNSIFGLWRFSSGRGSYTMNFRQDGSVVITLASGSTVVRAWSKVGDDGYFVNWGSARYTYRVENGRLVSNGGDVGSR